MEMDGKGNSSKKSAKRMIASSDSDCDDDAAKDHSRKKSVKRMIASSDSESDDDAAKNSNKDDAAGEEGGGDTEMKDANDDADLPINCLSLAPSIREDGKKLALFFPVGSIDESTEELVKTLLLKCDISRWPKLWFENPKIEETRRGLFCAHDQVTAAYLPTLLTELRIRSDGTSMADCIDRSYDKMQDQWKNFAKGLSRDLEKWRLERYDEDDRNGLKKIQVNKTLKNLGLGTKECKNVWKKLDCKLGCVFFQNITRDNEDPSVLPCSDSEEGYDDTSSSTAVIVRLLDVSDSTTGLIVVIPCGPEKKAFLDAEEALTNAEAAEEVSRRPVMIELTGKEECEGISRSLEVCEEDLSKYTLGNVKETVRLEFLEPGKGGQATIDVKDIRITVNCIVGMKPQDLSEECSTKCSSFEDGQLAVTVQDILNSAAIDIEGAENSAITCVELHIFVKRCEQHDKSPPFPSTQFPKRDEAFPEQKDTARRLLNRVKWVMQNKLHQRLEDFQATDYLIVVPTFHTLMEQTLSRARKTLDHRKREDEFRAEQKVMMCQWPQKKHSSGCKTSVPPPEFQAFVDKIKRQKSTFFVLVIDESHWGAKKGGAYDCIINDPAVRQHNVMVLQVSATPYCNLTVDSRIPEQYIIAFDEGNIKKCIEQVSSADASVEERNILFSQCKEELNVVKWFPPGVKRAPGAYVRLEDFLQTIPSKIRHDAVSRESGQGEPQKPIKRPISSRLIRSDHVLDERMPQAGKKKSSKVVAEFAWLVDFVFSMVYFATRWVANEQRLLDLTTASREYEGRWEIFERCMLRAEQSFSGKRKKKSASKANDLVEDCALSLKAARDALFVQIQDSVRNDNQTPAEMDVEKKKKLEQICDKDVKEMNGDEKDYLVAEFLKLKENDERNLWTEDNQREMYCTETDRIVLDLLTHELQEVCGKQITVGHMTVVRVSATDYGDLLRVIVQDARDALFPCTDGKIEKIENTFAVIQDTGTSSVVHSLERRFKEIPVAQAGSNNLTTLLDILEKEDRKNLTYTDLEGVPCLLFLCEKGRMGDTFPSSFVCLDLRIRTSENTTTLVQELGRLSRYFARFKANSDIRFRTQNDIEAQMQNMRLSEGSSPPTFAVFAYTSETSPNEEACDTIFRGFARSVEPWSNECTCKLEAWGFLSGGGVTMSSKEIPDRGNTRGCKASTGANKKGFCLDKPHPSSLVGCRVVKFDEGCKKNIGEENQKILNTLVYRTVQEHEENSNYLVLDDVFPPELDRKQRYSILRDESCLEELCRKCPYGGVIKILRDGLPYALVTKTVMSYLETARDNADRFWLEISDCIKMRMLDRYVQPNPTAKNGQLTITDTTNEVHDYRRSYFAKGMGDEVSVDYWPDRTLQKDSGWLHGLRFQLAAECQIGKTGAYLHFIRLLQEEITGIPLPMLPVPPSSELFKSLDTTVEGYDGWFLPYWHDISRENQKWELFETQGICRGKYHPKVMMQRLELLLMVLTDSSSAKKEWPAQAEEMKRRLALPPDASSMGECVHSSVLLDRLDSSLNEWKTFVQAPVEVQSTGETSENKRFSSLKQKLCFRVVDRHNLMKIVDWDCPQSCPQSSVFADQSSQEDPLKTNESLIKCEDGLYELQRELGNCSVQALAWPSPVDAVSAGSGLKLTDSEHPYVARVMLMLSDSERVPPSAQRQDKTKLKLATEMGGVSLAALFGDEQDDWPCIYMRAGWSHIDSGLFEVVNDRVIKATPRSGKLGDMDVGTWVFTPSYGRHMKSAQKALLDRSCVYSGQVTQFLVVRAEELEEYYDYLGSEYLVISLPKKIVPRGVPNLDLKMYTGDRPELCFTPAKGGCGYARLFIQLLAHLLGLKNVFLVDDNVHACYQLDLQKIFSTEPPLKQEIMPCTFSTILASLEREFGDIGEDHDKKRAEGSRKSCPFSSSPSLFPSRSWQSPRGSGLPKKSQETDFPSVKSKRDFAGDERAYAVVGIRRDPQCYLKDRRAFKITHSVYSMYLLNVEETVQRGVYYAPKPFWEDITFNQKCEENDMAVLKCNRFFHCKWNSQDRNSRHSRGNDCVVETTQVQVLVHINGREPFDFVPSATPASISSVWEEIREALNKKFQTPKRFFKVHVVSDEGNQTLNIQVDGTLNTGSDDVAMTPLAFQIHVFFVFQMDEKTIVTVDDADCPSQKSLAEVLSAWISSSKTDIVFTSPPAPDALEEESDVDDGPISLLDCLSGAEEQLCKLRELKNSNVEDTMTEIITSEQLTVFVKQCDPKLVKRSVVKQVHTVIKNTVKANGAIRTVQFIYPLRLLVPGSGSEIAVVFNEVRVKLLDTGGEILLFSSREPNDQQLLVCKTHPDLDDSFIIFEVRRQPKTADIRPGKVEHGLAQDCDPVEFLGTSPTSDGSSPVKPVPVQDCAPVVNPGPSIEQLVPSGIATKAVKTVQVSKSNPSEETPAQPEKISDIQLMDGKMTDKHLVFFLHTILNQLKIDEIIDKVQGIQGFESVQKKTPLKEQVEKKPLKEQVELLSKCKPVDAKLDIVADARGLGLLKWLAKKKLITTYMLKKAFETYGWESKSRWSQEKLLEKIVSNIEEGEPTDRQTEVATTQSSEVPEQQVKRKRAQEPVASKDKVAEQSMEREVATESDTDEENIGDGSSQNESNGNGGKRKMQSGSGGTGRGKSSKTPRAENL